MLKSFRTRRLMHPMLRLTQSTQTSSGNQRMTRMLFPVILTLIGSGCKSLPHIPIEMPPRPVLPPVTQEMWGEMSEETRNAVRDRDAGRRSYAERLECRIIIHNGGECVIDDS